MARLEQALQLRQLAQRLTASKPDQALNASLVFASLTKLQRSRPRLIASLRRSPVGRTARKINHSKLNLWAAIANPEQAKTEQFSDLLSNVQQTDAWTQACNIAFNHHESLAQQGWNYKLRLQNAEQVLNSLRSRLQQGSSHRIVFWHHFDALGYVPISWRDALLDLHQRGWIVVVSSSTISDDASHQLETYGCIVSWRDNQGLCLGAYKDFCCLISENKDLRDRLQSLVLCNDSTLPVGGPEPFCREMERLTLNGTDHTPELAGLTDSIETNAYHLQTYCIAANHALLTDQSWDQFWQTFNPFGSKDDLIQRGEIGLSQWLIKRDVTLKPIYSLTGLLLNSNDLRSELDSHGLDHPNSINLTLMGWKTLLKQGFPLIKKHLLFDPPEVLSGPIPLGELADQLTTSDKRLEEDLKRLMQSRFLKA